MVASREQRLQSKINVLELTIDDIDKEIELWIRYGHRRKVKELQLFRDDTIAELDYFKKIANSLSII